MSEATKPGERLRAITDVPTFLDEESALGLSARFEHVDAILGAALEASFNGQELLETGYAKDGTGLLRLTTLTDEQRVWLGEDFTGGAHEAKGSWYVPNPVKVGLGPFALVSALLTKPRFTATVLAGQNADAASSSGEAVFVWAALTPLFDGLVVPLALRSRQAGTKTAEEIRRAWVAIDALTDALGFQGEEALEAFRSPAGWGHASPELHIERRLRLGEMLQRHASPELGRRYRAYRLQTLIQRYYAKAKRERPTKAQVLTKADERSLTALFAGDWLAFVDYLGEQPAEGEEMVTALPEPKLFVSGGQTAETIAASAGVPAAEVQRILGALFGSGEAVSPIKEREAALRRLWVALDDLYARQEPSMISPSRYVLGEDWGDDDDEDDENDAGEALSWESRTFLDELRDATLASEELKAGSTSVRLPAEIVNEVEELWGRETIERFPSVIVTCLQPWKQAEAALGPALAFWHGIIETLWSFFEERYEDYAVSGLQSRFKTELEEFAALGCPVDTAIFDELARVERTLPPAQDIVVSEGLSRVVAGVELSIVMTAGRRRPGFEKLRDVITRHRRAWTQRHLDSYVERRWQDELRATAEAINRHHAEKGKTPTARQLAGYTAASANRWSGGSIGVLCAAIGEKDTLQQTSAQLVPANRRMFVAKLFALLGEQVAPKIDYRNDDEPTQAKKQDAAQRQRGVSVLAIRALKFLQLEEALGTAPTPKQFGGSDFAMYAERAWGAAPVDEHWERYTSAIPVALTGDVTPAVLPAPRSSRKPVSLSDIEPEQQPARPVAPTPAEAKKRGGLLGRLFGRDDDRPSPPRREKSKSITVEAYVLESEGPSDVVGESHYQEALEATRAVLRHDAELGEDVFDAILVAEPGNEYDSEAVAVYSPRGKIGYVPRGSGWFDVLDALEADGHNAATCRASLIGGDRGKSLGVILHADPDDELELLDR